ncbi:transferrin-like isoform X1 [Vespa mandarinia]|uniref:transferrin-like isoform X1 n=1 Tax=Vespa mandarinia TaxID=7446 RepID=UPI00161A605A|nr:transferrin-like isoform X1 [Vespa mandarinia]XP_035735121.1 transferrin-like isoform X1 [Vespa mandarinia]XP_035735122.1 transferrin-like isoform X1 [Vespa mandarinia]XP_035735123.1 transferrin-like isoform X1 [Vespa mandarinia]
MNLWPIFYHILLYAVIFAFDKCDVVYAEKLKICVVESVNTNETINKILPNMKISPFQCVIANDRFDCLRQLTTGTADITLLQAEDLLAASMYNKYSFLVTHELRLFSEDKQQFEMVALVRQNINNMWDAKEKRFCHPGFETTDTYTKALSMYFENWIIPKECDPEKTLLENRVARLSNYFEAGCIAGPWIADATFDTKLKSKYKNLCSLCDNSASCYIGDKYYGREGAILCLTDNVGDIAWVRLDDVLQYFKNVETNKEDYAYLCPDGMTRSANTDNPCIWVRQPWPVIVARSKIAEMAVNIIDLTIKSKNIWKNTLQDLLAPYHSTFVKTEPLESPTDYLQRYPGFLSANDRATCQPTRRVRWCVSTNIEDQKCRWLREASFVYGIEPIISCVQESNRSSCLKAIRDQRADIFVSKPEERLEVSKMGLKPILQVTSNKKKDYNRIVAIVKSNSSFKSFKDLKGAKACFTGYESIGWNSFVTIMKNISEDNWDCSSIKAVGNFFGDSCVPGISSIKNIDVPYNLYSLCTTDVNVDDDINTLSCLTSDRADVVFVNLKNIQKEINISNTVSSNLANGKYKILCIKEIETAKEEEEMCSLTWTTLGAIVAHKNITDLRHNDIYSTLLSMDQLFGTSVRGYTKAFSLYGTYDNHKNVIFPEESQHLQREVNKIRRIRNYDDIVEEIMIKPICNSAQNWSSGFDKINLLGLLILIALFTLY